MVSLAISIPIDYEVKANLLQQIKALIRMCNLLDKNNIIQYARPVSHYGGSEMKIDLTQLSRYRV